MKVHFQRRSIILLVALLFGIVLGLFSFISINANASTELPEGGRSFTADDDLRPVKRIEEQPKTYEALFYAPSDVARPGILFGNHYDSSKYAGINFEISQGGQPSIILSDRNTNRFIGTFNVDVRINDWVHLVITHETTESGSTFNCYVNGVLVDTLSSELVFEYNMEHLQSQHWFALAKDNRTTTSRHFRGKLKNLALYSDVLTADEIKAAYENGVNAANEDLIAYYQLDNTEGATFIKDSSKNGYDLQAIMQPNRAPLDPADYDYSFAIIGDTQNQVRPDVYNDTNYSDYYFDWIVANKDSKKISYVIGLGDMTDRDGKDQTKDDGIDQTNEEWRIVTEQHKKLTAAGIPYSIIRGNHDGVKINDYFAGNDNFNNQDVCYFDSNSLLNYYVRFAVGQEKYMIVCLDFDTTEDVLEWAADAIEENSDYRVIITTHSYVDNRLEINDMFSASSSRTPTSTNKSCNGNQIWTELASQYKNVIMVLAGHVSSHDILMREDVGVHGNTVYQFLIDPQGIDNHYLHKTSMVAMFYFSNGGKTVNVEYVSTYHTINNDDGNDYILNAYHNQFAFNISEYQEVLPVECKYGVIDAKYASATTYPFVVFKNDKTFIGGYGELSDAIAAVSTNGKNDNFVILMRRNAELRDETVNLVDFRGSITVDLGGYTLLKAQDGSVFAVNVEDNSASTVDENGFDIGGTFVISNGSVWKYGATPIVSVNYGTNLVNNYKAFFEFNGITFVNKNGTSCNILATNEDGGGNDTGACVYPYAVFNDCTFDYTNSVDNSNMLSLDSSDGYNRVVWDVRINGGVINSAKGLGFSEFATLDKGTDGRGDTIVFAKGNDGSLLKMRLPSTLEDPMTVFLASDGDYIFTKASEEGEFAIYVLETFDGLVTKYGVVPSEYLDTKLYPILLFQNGKFINGFASFCTSSSGKNTDAIHAAKNRVDGNSASEIGETVQLLLRDDITVKTKYNNICQSQGTIVIDLNGHKFIQAYSGTTFVSQIKYYNGFGDATIECRNGEMILNGELLRFDCYGDAYNQYTTDTEYKTLHMNFDNVKFTYAKGASATEFLGMYNEHSSTVDGKKGGYNVRFNDCIFDFTNAASMGTIMNANDPDSTKTNSIVNVRVNGGEIICTKPMNALYDVNATNGSSVVFGVGSDGKYLKMTVVGSDEAPSVTANDGSLEFVKEGDTDSEGRTTYVLTPAPIRTPYGEIPFEYRDAEKYPLVVFQNGKFDSAHADFASSTESKCALGRAKALTASTPGLKAEILVRNNITVSTTIDNQGQIQGDVVIDLDGYTMTASGSYLFSGIAKNWKGIHDSSFTVINGNVVLDIYGLVNMGASGSKYSDTANSTTGVYKTTSYIFKNVHISLAKGATVNNLLGNYYEGTSITSDGCVVKFEYIFNQDCVIDVSNAIEGFILFDANDKQTSGLISGTAYSTNCIVNVKVEGSKIIASTSDITIFDINKTNTSSVEFAANKYGLYTEFVFPIGVSAPNERFNEGKLTLIKKSESEEKVTYTLIQNVNFVPKMSITLGNNFVMNVYVPANNALQNIVFNGETYTVSDLEAGEKVTRDDNVYYVLKAELPSAEAIKSITLKATIALAEENNTTATFTFSIPKYAAKVLKDENATEIEKTLVKDVLAYVKAAYNYFKEYNTAEEIARVNTLIESIIGDYTAAPTISGTVAKDNSGTVTDVTLNLDAKPTIRFYVTNTTVSFYQNGKKLNTVSGVDEERGAYLELDVYAYALAETITFGEGGSYHISSFVNGSKGTDHEALVNAFAKYVESAADYRRAVIGVEN